MSSSDRSKFDTKEIEVSGFNKLVKSPKKSVEIDGENNFGNDAFSKTILARETTAVPKKQEVKRGRPRVILDERYTVCKPKKISAALEVKLKVLEYYMREFQEVNGRITFEMMVNALADNYINQSLSIGKSEKIQEDIKIELEKIK